MKKDNTGDIRLTVLVPEGIEQRTMDVIRKRVAARILLRNMMRYAAGAVMALAVTFTVWFGVLPHNSTKIVLIYAFHGEKKVEVAGSFNGWDERIAMKHDVKNDVWSAEITVEGKGVFEYQFIVDDVIYTAGQAEYKVKDEQGNEVGIMSL
ncbi:MAG: hypothetical protein A2014_04845 [Spirochaetes bacterium GWF1_49_6]|nr:MAG: hypothetical protein A2014_04845 [Spirochaetes bacterium GWF1_49_6]